MRRSLFPRWAKLRKEVPDVDQLIVEDLPGVVE
jgi:hypothetical protein